MSSSSDSSECRQKIRPDAASFPWRTATRPDSSKPPGRGRPASGKDAQAPRTAAAAKPSARRTTNKSALQPLDGIGERFVVRDRKSTRLNSSHQIISYAVFCLKKKKKLNRSL